MKYSIGEKVCFYDRGERYYGTVIGIEKDYYLIETRLLVLPVHEKQIRKIKVKPKRRDFWITSIGNSKDKPYRYIVSETYEQAKNQMRFLNDYVEIFRVREVKNEKNT